MKVVLYTRDLEPITVVDLPLWALEHGQRLGRVMVHVPGKITASGGVIQVDMDPVRIEFHPLRTPAGGRGWLLVADDEVKALGLDAAFLPGQTGKVRKIEQDSERLGRLLLEVLARGVGGH